MRQTNIERDILKTVRAGLDEVDELVQRLQSQENEQHRRGEYITGELQVND